MTKESGTRRLKGFTVLFPIEPTLWAVRKT